MNIALLLNKQPTPLPRLCGDIVNIIVDFLSEDRDTLLACSLVGHDWVHRSQTYLLEDIILTNQDRLSIFLSRLPTMTQRVRRMVHVLQVGYCKDWHGLMQISRIEVISILDSFPNLVQLMFHDIQLCGVEESIGTEYIPRSLDALHFRDVVGASHSQACPLEIIAFVNLFHTLRVLDVFSTLGTRDLPYPTGSMDDLYAVILQSSSTMPISLHVTELLINRTPLAVPLLRFLRIAGAVRTLRTVFLACYRLNALSAFHDLFADDPSKLEKLHLDFVPYARLMEGDVLDVLNWEIDPSSFRRLQTVWARINFDPICLPSSVLMWHRMISMLDHLSKTHAKELEIVVCAAPSCPPPKPPMELVAQTLRGLDWARLDQILRQYHHLLEYPYIRVNERDEEMRAARRYLEIIFYRLPLCRYERRVRLEWFSCTTCTARSLTDMMGPIGGLLLPPI